MHKNIKNAQFRIFNCGRQRNLHKFFNKILLCLIFVFDCIIFYTLPNKIFFFHLGSPFSDIIILQTMTNLSFKISDLAGLLDESKNILGLIVIISYLWGFIGKVIFYNHINSFKVRERPLNALILLGEIIYHSVISFITANLLIVLFAKESPSKFFFNQLGLKVNEQVCKYCIKLHTVLSGIDER